MSLIQNIQKIGDKLVASFKGGGQANVGTYTPWITIPYSEMTFQASSGTWTVDSGDLVFARYTIKDNIMWYHVYINTSTTSASTVYLRLFLPDLPSGYSYYDDGTPMIGKGSGSTTGSNSVNTRIFLAANTLRIYSDSGSWPAATNVIYCNFLIPVPLRN